jgi:hypothetical protein
VGDKRKKFSPDAKRSLQPDLAAQLAVIRNYWVFSKKDLNVPRTVKKTRSVPANFGGLRRVEISALSRIRA